jgi:hypothetical protein
MKTSKQKEIKDFLKERSYCIKIEAADFDLFLQILDDYDNRNRDIVVSVKKTLDQRKKEFGLLIATRIGDVFKGGELTREDALDFYNHWTETSPNQTKMPFEKKVSFDIGKRIGTWMTNKAKFAKNDKNNGKSNIDDIYSNILNGNTQQKLL